MGEIPIIPDGNGGILATWTISPASGPPPQYPYQVADVSGGAVGTPYSLPFSPTTVTFGQSPTLVLGENGIAFATDGVNTNNGPSVVSFNISSGSTNLLYQAASGDTLSIIEATADGGVTISDANAGGVVQVAGTGNGPSASRIHRIQTTPASSSLLGAVPYDLGLGINRDWGGHFALEPHRNEWYSHYPRSVCVSDASREPARTELASFLPEKKRKLRSRPERRSTDVLAWETSEAGSVLVVLPSEWDAHAVGRNFPDTRGKNRGMGSESFKSKHQLLQLAEPKYQMRKPG